MLTTQPAQLRLVPPRGLHCASLLVAVLAFSCGASNSDGNPSGAGGTSGAGTAGAGGAPPSGGATATAGSTATAGATAMAGSSATAGSSGVAGGTANGGAANGGAANGGAANGGATNGGAANGGAANGGSGGRNATGGAAGAGGASGFTLSSPVLAAGAMFPAANTCAGVNQSLELDWTAGPAGTMSYALVMTDTNNSLLHWVIWDIPAATRSLPAMLATTQTLVMPAGAHQVSIATYGYAGPCPNGQNHIYRFDLHAIGIDHLGGLPPAPTTAQANTAILAASLGKASLSGQSNARGP